MNKQLIQHQKKSVNFSIAESVGVLKSFSWIFIKLLLIIFAAVYILCWTILTCQYFFELISMSFLHWLNWCTVDFRKLELFGDQKNSYWGFEFLRNGLKAMKITGLLSQGIYSLFIQYKIYHTTKLYTLQSNLLLERNQTNGFVQALYSFFIQKGLYFQSKRPNLILMGTEQWEILKLVQSFLNIPLDGRVRGGGQSRSSILSLRSSSLSSPSSSSSIVSGRTTLARISASLIHEADVTTPLSKSTNDSNGKVSWTVFSSNLCKLSSSSSKLMSGSSARLQQSAGSRGWY